MSDNEPFDSKAEQFERLWDGITPKGVNRTKALKFRQKMFQHLLSVRHPQHKENARRYWMGELQQAIRLREGF